MNILPCERTVNFCATHHNILAFKRGLWYDLTKETDCALGCCIAAARCKKGRKMALVYEMMQVNMAVIWLFAMVVLLIVEAAVPGLVSIWFALGALAALIASMAGAPLWLQLVWFFLVSLLCLWITRPLAKKYLNSRTTPTNADMLIGQECLVTEEIDNIKGSGAVSVGGKEWTARMADREQRAQVGQTVTVERIEGVKLIVH